MEEVPSALPGSSSPEPLDKTIDIPIGDIQKELTNGKTPPKSPAKPEPISPAPVKMDTIAIPYTEGGEPGPMPVQSEPETIEEPKPFGTAAGELSPEKLLEEKQKLIEKEQEVAQPEPEASMPVEVEPVDWDQPEETPSESTSAEITSQPLETATNHSSGIHDIEEEIRKEILDTELKMKEEEEEEEEKEEEKKEEKEPILIGRKRSDTLSGQLAEEKIHTEQDDGELSFESTIGEAVSEPKTFTSGVTLEDVYTFVDEHILRSKDGKQFPTFVVVGLPGSGKTSYLTMLGAILLLTHERENQLFHFPYEVSVGWVNAGATARKVFGKRVSGKKADLVKAIETSVRDLAQDFAHDHYFNYVQRMLFPPHTPVSAEDAGKISGAFLIAELQKAGKTVAKLATLEISGEDVKTVLNNITYADVVKRLKTAEQRVFLRLLEKSKGYVILVDAGSADKDDKLYQPLFMVLRDELHKRFFTHLRGLVEEELKKIAQEKGEGVTDVTRIFKQVREADEAARQRKERLNSCATTMKEEIAQMRQTVATKGPETVLAENTKWHNLYKRITQWLSEGLEQDVVERMGEMGEGYRERHKERQAKYKENRLKLKNLLQSTANKDKIFISYIGWLCSFIMKPENFKDMVFYFVLREELRQIRSDYEEAVQRVLKRYGIPSSYGPAVSELAETEEPSRFTELKYIAIVITKTDSHKIVYPPERFAEQQMIASNQYLRDIQMYLRVFGGHLRFYNASISGYSVQIDTTSYVAPCATLTPINVVEPFFDMLVAEGLVRDVRQT